MICCPCWALAHGKLCGNLRHGSSTLSIPQANHSHEELDRGGASGAVGLGQPGAVSSEVPHVAGIRYGRSDRISRQYELHGATCSKLIRRRAYEAY
jgi:hypothetical protein